MQKAAPALLLFLLASTAGAQDAPEATDVHVGGHPEVSSTRYPAMPSSDRPIRVVEVTGDYRVGVYGVFRPQSPLGGANLHQVDTTEIYYMVEGVATLVTGGELIDPTQAPQQHERPGAPAFGTGCRGASPRETSSSSRDVPRTGGASSRPISST